MEEDKPDEMSAPDDAGDQTPTIELPLADFPTPPKPGDMLHLKVISVDENSGVINATPMSALAEEGGSDEMAKEFDKPQGQA